MNSNVLAKWCTEHPNVDVYMENTTFDENGETLEIQYFDFTLQQWDENDPESHWTLEPTELISG